MFIDGVLLVILAICVATDLKTRKIYNKVVFPGLAAAFGLHLALGGWQALIYAMAGFLVGLGILLIPYLLGGMGAGDVKLLAVIGALKGTMFVLAASVYMALLGGAIALAILLLQKGAKRRLQWLLTSLCCRRYGVKLPLIADAESMQTTYPYGVAIAGGAILSLFLEGRGVI